MDSEGSGAPPAANERAPQPPSASRESLLGEIAAGGFQLRKVGEPAAGHAARDPPAHAPTSLVGALGAALAARRFAAAHGSDSESDESGDDWD